MTTLYEKVIHEVYEKGKQLRLVLSEFKDTEYLHIRIYYTNMDGEWLPTKEGIAIPTTINNIYELLDGIVDVASKKEGLDAVSKHITSKLENIKNES